MLLITLRSFGHFSLIWLDLIAYHTAYHTAYHKRQQPVSVLPHCLCSLNCCPLLPSMGGGGRVMLIQTVDSSLEQSAQ